MNARMFAVLPFAIAIGLFAAPALAQNAMPASSDSTMPHNSMHKHSTMMKKDSMQHAMMKHKTMHHAPMMKSGDSMKMDKAGSAPKSSGG